ncbi:uncharacterized protein PHALS_15030 [Plasmopara halstedii]|uniref:Uncharacterized protein n=1 Tax=Plasmopara halstedii TaxID=4781 RepID=A0A0N7L3Y2_PLAHL|nr:uncharacterized protein PHALS_15030 [Plasmopara halstedii]CEG37147.1 hypothetical protein PHALS_15030 [Plasmopara halstedii]|eukprot:XP_024573516.1 hypothetical protein PHALS_15030 [Plasmopara halstedii]
MFTEICCLPVMTICHISAVFLSANDFSIIDAANTIIINFIHHDIKHLMKTFARQLRFHIWAKFHYIECIAAFLLHRWNW